MQLPRWISMAVAAVALFSATNAHARGGRPGGGAGAARAAGAGAGAAARGGGAAAARGGAGAAAASRPGPASAGAVNRSPSMSRATAAPRPDGTPS
ncbi:MAG TPA: hypothetical protein VGX78_03845, partial [Pirellulales bacterium]|nr:hypothetical protein [Pirellulales bacterium]